MQSNRFSPCYAEKRCISGTNLVESKFDAELLHLLEDDGGQAEEEDDDEEEDDEDEDPFGGENDDEGWFN